METGIPMRFSEKLKLVPFVRVTLFLVVGILAGQWALLLFPLLVVPYFRSFRPYLLTALTGGLLVLLHREPRILPSGETVRLTVSMEQRLRRDYFEARVLSFSDSLRTVYPRGNTSVVVSMDTMFLNRVHRGDILTFDAWVENMEKDYPDSRSYRRRLMRDGFTQLVFCGGPVRRVPPHKSFTLHGSAEQVRACIASRFARLTLPPNDIGALTAMISGDREGLPQHVRRRYAAGGISHILAISGLHVGIVALMLNFLLAWMNRIYRLRIVKTILIIFLLWCYAYVTGLSPSVCRAALMFSLFQAASFGVQSSLSRYNVLFASAFLMLAVSPSLVYDIGFQLSYLAVFALIFSLPKIEALFPAGNGFWRFILLSAGATLSIQLVTLPVVLYHFGTLSWVSFLNNIVITLFLPLLLLSGIAFLVYPFVLADKLLALCFHVIDDMLNITLSLPYAYLSGLHIGLPVLLALLVLLSGAMAFAEYRYTKYLRSSVLLSDR